MVSSSRIRNVRGKAQRRSYGTIRDVARETGLSIATVSRAVNGNENVSPQTRARVLDACERLDYLPNPAARALSTSKSRTVAAIIPSIENSVYAKFIAAIETTLTKRDYALVLAISNASEEDELKAARRLLGMGAEAFILSGATHSDTLLDMFERRRVPHVFTSVWDPENSCATIGYDNAALAAEAVRFLVAKGHRDICVVHGPLAENDRAAARKIGALSTHIDGLGLAFIETELSVKGGKSAVQSLLANRPPCTALLCFSDVLALGAYFALSAAGMKIPQQMSVMGFDNLDWSSETEPPLTTIDLPAIQMGHEVATQIADLLDRGETAKSHLLQGHIIERASVASLLK